MSMLTAGEAHNCMVSTAGIASCWGANGVGQLGDGSLTQRSTPVPVSGGYTFSLLTAGSGYTCGLTTSGEAYCWGSNTAGQLGDGTTSDSPLPVRVVSGP
jgi:alpha-tubulin suppressor-like RCC1 family protein